MTAAGHPRRSTAGRSTSTATAWFDHQWGDFISVGGGGWDWFAVNLDDGTDLTLSLVRDADGSYPLVYGTLVDGRRGSPRTSRATPSRSTSTDALDEPGDRRRLPGRLDASRSRPRTSTIELTPTVAAQELDTRATTGVIYWEGSQRVAATRDGDDVAGRGLRRADGLRAGRGAGRRALTERYLIALRSTTGRSAPAVTASSRAAASSLGIFLSTVSTALPDAL